MPPNLPSLQPISAFPELAAAPLKVERGADLRALNTFGIMARARAYVQIHALQHLIELRQLLAQDAELAALPRLVIGGGSNLLLLGDVHGLVVHMCAEGMQNAGEDSDYRYLRAAAGSNWHALVEWSLQQGAPGLENLALIPGTVGAAPIQNIGAYGVELKQVLHSVTVYDWNSGEVVVLDNADCAFGYRDSVFKHVWRERGLVLELCLACPKDWRAQTGYGDLAAELAQAGIDAPNAQQVAAAVCAIRRRKLPDPAKLGNAGSFFKNPVVTRAQRTALQTVWPDLVSYLQSDGKYKLAAGWLIDRAGWKGRRMGAAGVHEHQALVLVNHGGASGAEIAALAAAIQTDIQGKFGVKLEMEPVTAGG
ncbi:UDP-N-acetylmuramate dehydrogenase [Massilia sp. W12]|uniref:UDP-N-acetylmuramate dehydrogenase n=1 Tax=Massilia sp. W12 TaxID=3126507 RepID=UPI0030D23693